MDGFRYAQFCPLARASEILGERWTLPILRELLVGPQRFSDLLRRLPGLSSSVLATRLARLEGLRVVQRRELPPPAACQVYALGETGSALLPAVRELMRWGMRFLGAPQPGDHFEPDWILIALRVFLRAAAVPERSFEVQVLTKPEPIRVRLRGGASGGRVTRDSEPVDLAFSAPPLAVLGLASGQIDALQWLRDSGAAFEGDASAIRDFPAFFDMAPGPT